MKYYYYPATPNCRYPLMVAEQLGIPLEKHLVDLPKGEQKQSEFLRMNPNGKVPVLADENFYLWESNAIAQYLAEQKTNTLWPQNPKKRADISRWMFWQQAHWMRNIGPFLMERIFKDGSADLAVLEKATPELERFAEILNHQLEGRSFVTGEDLTLADLSLVSPLMYMEKAQIPLAKFRHIQNWFARIQKLDCWKKTESR